MTERVPPTSADALAAERSASGRQILSSVWYTVPGTIALVIGTYLWVWPSYAGPADLAGRLAFAIQCAFFAMIPFVATALVLVLRRLQEGTHDPLAGQEGRSLRIHQQVSRSHLQHLVWFAFCAVALSTRLNANEMRVLPVLTGIFIVARLLYWWSYVSGGPIRRAPAGQITLTVQVGLVITTVVGFAVRGVAG